jgi:single-strand DNA-binding protein
MSLNKVSLIGNLGQDPEIRATQDGREIANFSLATTENWKDKNTGERQSKTEWHRIVVFSQGLVGVIKNYVKKGSKLYIEGALQTRKWTDKSGVEKYTTEIVLQNYNSNLQILDSRNSQDSDQSIEGTIKNEFQGAKEVELDDDIPF